MKKGDDDSLPDWPQVYEKLIVVHTSGVDIPIECKAFAFTKMLSSWTTKNQDDTVLFQLFDLTIPPPTNPLYFMTAANTCVWIAFQGDCLTFSVFYCHLKV